ncbi:hypothetical protein SLEP1_g17365 [Rubroshorea leprosula]|uniref:N-acetyltransferase domain-containing protein n=1 Tax=Rubroshorea leprosula TaxID=152421 RepID=A0AAV5J2V8_9ROSI|nr:hypothetical protein SLEP1_g17365 [Rubroshorea leprosula]
MEEDDKGEAESSSPSSPPILEGRGRVREKPRSGFASCPVWLLRNNKIRQQCIKFGGFEKNLEFGGFEELEALVDVENIGSQRVLEKAGFTREGLLVCLELGGDAGERRKEGWRMRMRAFK